ncbi:hypothetical protein, partial [Okeania sp. SIO2G5]|uniref:hypothetical protein n=1 Tax=Okeania sp. SIO2G5 TaxID=2607796 RepID=UPI00257C1980
ISLGIKENAIDQCASSQDRIKMRHRSDAPFVRGLDIFFQQWFQKPLLLHILQMQIVSVAHDEK